MESTATMTASKPPVSQVPVRDRRRAKRILSWISWALAAATLSVGVLWLAPSTTLASALCSISADFCFTKVDVVQPSLP